MLRCVPDGTVSLGEACSRGPAGETTGYDDCIAALYCIDGACQDVCGPYEDSTAVCPTGFACTRYADTFSNADEDPAAGICNPACDPLTQTKSLTPTEGWGTRNGCYVLTSQTTTIVVYARAGTVAHDEDVVGPGYRMRAYRARSPAGRTRRRRAWSAAACVASSTSTRARTPRSRLAKRRSRRPISTPVRTPGARHRRVTEQTARAVATSGRASLHRALAVQQHVRLVLRAQRLPVRLEQRPHAGSPIPTLHLADHHRVADRRPTAQRRGVLLVRGGAASDAPERHPQHQGPALAIRAAARSPRRSQPSISLKQTARGGSASSSCCGSLEFIAPPVAGNPGTRSSSFRGAGRTSQSGRA